LNVFTEKQIHDLNWMNRAAQNAELGTVLNEIIVAINEGGGGVLPDDIAKIVKMPYDSFPSIGDDNSIYIDSDTGYSYTYTQNKGYMPMGITESQFNELIDNISVINGGTI